MPVSRLEALEESGIRRRGSSGRWKYEWPSGRSAGQQHVKRIEGLVIPPAWENVLIAPDPDDDLQVIGRDSRGRLQYLYHEDFREQRELEKFVRIADFAEELPRLRRRVVRDLREDRLSFERVLAGAVRLIDQAFFRVGNEKSAREEETFGLTTLRPEHLELSQGEMEFRFPGKWGKLQLRATHDEETAALITEMLEAGDGEIFKFERHDSLQDVKARHVNSYIRDAIGEEFSAKDFRTWGGTLVCAAELSDVDPAETEYKRKRQVTSAVKATAQMLGNTPAVCRSSYICPRLLTEFTEGRSFVGLRTSGGHGLVARTTLSIQEKALLRFLRETVADRRARSR